MGIVLAMVKGFAPRGIVERLKEAQWYEGTDHGGSYKNFSMIGLGGYCLSEPPDRHAPDRFLVVVTDMKTGEKFSVTGCAFSDMPMAVKTGPPAFKLCSFFSDVLESEQQEGRVEYSIEIFCA